MTVLKKYVFRANYIVLKTYLKLFVSSYLSIFKKSSTINNLKRKIVLLYIESLVLFFMYLLLMCLYYLFKNSDHLFEVLQKYRGSKIVQN